MNTNIPVEQLWYTWSDVGLGSMHAGLRIRAASAGLTEIYSPRMQSVDRYMHYDLPSGTDPFAVTPEMTPVGLAFIRTDQNEYILVHKNYSGKDGVGRPGNFFVHVLALGEYSSYFFAKNAIRLWDFDRWETNDQSLKDPRSTTLETISSADLNSNPRFRPQYSQVREALAFVIEAYLTRKGRAPLYIAAPAHQAALIAYVIAGLTACLPKQLLADLTFSTYEPDITKATTDIVGTSWIATPGQTAQAVMPEQWYHDQLAINCATGMHSRLLGHPQADTKPLATHFATYATDCLATKNTKVLNTFRSQVEKRKTLTVDLFLQLYNKRIVNKASINEADIEQYLTDSDLYLDWLNDEESPGIILDRVLKNPQWGETRLAPILSTLRSQTKNTGTSPSTSGASLAGTQKSSLGKQAVEQMEGPLTLAEALTHLAQEAIPEIVSITSGAQMVGIGANGEITFEKQQIIALIKVMDSCLTPQDPNEVWQALLTNILKDQSATMYLNHKTQWDIRFWLLQIWNRVLPITEEVDNEVRPLIVVPWSRFGKFLHANLSGRHKQWLFFAAEGALGDSSLTPQIAQDLTQNFSKEIYTLLSQFLQDNNSTIATDLLVKLVKQGYKLGPQMSTLVEQLLTLLNRDGLWQYAKGLVETLTHAKYVGLASYQSQVEALLGNLLTIALAEGNALLDLLVDYGYPRKKALLDLLLATGRGRADLERSIKRVYRTPEEQNEFFLHDAAPLLKQPDTVQAIVSLYWELLRSLPEDGKMARLFVVLEGSLDETTILSLLKNSSLTENEQVQLLEQFGSRYFIVAQKAPRLAQFLISWFDQLVQRQYTNGATLLFHLLDPGIDPHYLEHLLKTASLSVPESQQLFKNYGRAAKYVPFFRQSPTALALFAQFAQAVNKYKESIEGRQKLSKEKMDTVFAWLNLSIPFHDQRTAEPILQAAALTPEEQITFLDTYGTYYLPLYQQLPILAEYVSTYIKRFTFAELDRAETKPLFATLERYYQHLHLSPAIQQHIGYWLDLDKYLTSPHIDPEALRKLATALMFLPNIPLDASFTKNLARAFVFRVRTTDDLTTIMRHIEQAPNVRDDELRLLYAVAEQAATYYSQQTTDSLLPYLLFALTWPVQYRPKHFRHEFLDTLLRDVQETDLVTWSRLYAIVMQQGLPQEAVERWRFYLDRLGLLDQISTSEETTSSTTASPQSFWSLFGKKNKQQSAPPVPNSYEAAAPEYPEQHSPSAQKGLLPHKQPKAMDIGGSRPDANSSQGGTKFRVQGEDSKQKRKK